MSAPDRFLLGTSADWGSSPIAVWSASTTKNVGDIVRPVNPLSYQAFRCITAGTTGGTEPSWQTGPSNTSVEYGKTTTDGSVVWGCCTGQESVGWGGCFTSMGDIQYYNCSSDLNGCISYLEDCSHVLVADNHVYACNVTTPFSGRFDGMSYWVYGTQPRTRTDYIPPDFERYYSVEAGTWPPVYSPGAMLNIATEHWPTFKGNVSFFGWTVNVSYTATLTAAFYDCTINLNNNQYKPYFVSASIGRAENCTINFVGNAHLYISGTFIGTVFTQSGDITTPFISDASLYAMAAANGFNPNPLYSTEGITAKFWGCDLRCFGLRQYVFDISGLAAGVLELKGCLIPSVDTLIDHEFSVTKRNKYKVHVRGCGEALPLNPDAYTYFTNGLRMDRDTSVHRENVNRELSGHLVSYRIATLPRMIDYYDPQEVVTLERELPNTAVDFVEVELLLQDSVPSDSSSFFVDVTYPQNAKTNRGGAVANSHTHAKSGFASTRGLPFAPVPMVDSAENWVGMTEGMVKKKIRVLISPEQVGKVVVLVWAVRKGITAYICPSLKFVEAT